MLRVGVKNVKRVDVTPLLGWEGGGCNWLYLFVAPQASFNMLQYCIRLGGWVGGGGGPRQSHSFRTNGGRGRVMRQSHSLRIQEILLSLFGSHVL